MILLWVVVLNMKIEEAPWLCTSLFQTWAYDKKRRNNFFIQNKLQIAKTNFTVMPAFKVKDQKIA